MLERFTIRPASLWRRSGRNACVVAIKPKRFVSNVFAPGVERLLADFFLFVVHHYSGVVDQNIEPAKIPLHFLGCPPNALLVIHIDFERLNIEAFRLQLSGRSLAFREVACAQQDGHALLSQVAGPSPARCLCLPL